MIDLKSGELKNYLGKEVIIDFPKTKENYVEELNSYVWYGKSIGVKILSVDESKRLLKVFYNGKVYEINFSFIGSVTYKS
jgi:translation initiation factor 2 alpha subunit (eIF-2alpha)